MSPLRFSLPAPYVVPTLYRPIHPLLITKNENLKKLEKKSPVAIRGFSVNQRTDTGVTDDRHPLED